MIFDAKYYCIQLECGKPLRGQPGVGDVTKQYLYQLAYQDFIDKNHIREVKNCFLMPTEQVDVVKLGTASLSILRSLGLADIQIRLLPAVKMYDLYLNRKPLGISTLEL